MIRSIKIYTDIQSYGPCPDVDDEVIQHFSLHSSGKVIVTHYNYGVEGNHKLIQKEYLRMPKEETVKILSAFEKYFVTATHDPMLWTATDVGTWEAFIVTEDGKNFKFTGSVCDDLKIGGKKISASIRKILDQDDLFLFGGID